MLDVTHPLAPLWPAVHIPDCYSSLAVLAGPCPSLPYQLFIPEVIAPFSLSPAFLVVCPNVWNRLPLALRLLPLIHSDALYPNPKLFLLAILGQGAPLSSNLEEVLNKSL